MGRFSITENGQEEWIRDYADPNRVYFGGDSAGGNIAHNMAMRVGSEKVDGINLSGIFLNCPFFGGEDLIGDEGADKFTTWKRLTDKLWLLICPGLSGLDEPWINPGKDDNLSGLGCKKVLVYVAEKDYLKDRGWYYKEVLLKSGWDGNVECVEAKGEEHVFSVFSPDGENGLAMLKKLLLLLMSSYS
ncbi:hypothetical protein DH2020_030578 [Rehmannia glutinosa]|uniref:Alpha/beta hydrolase fold-3 domain-containing protein n=1 Tax=Rehmannia glutinosa TaxID=99300 RepID=A0ABR0VMV5_REHGL